jgi:hypothetical protein
MNLKYVLLWIGLFSAHAVIAQQDSSFSLAKIIKGDIVDFNVDKLGNIYLLSSDNQLKKIGPSGDSLAVFNEVRRFGKIYSVDPTNPLKILLYYKEFATVVEVDRFLNILNTIDLRTQNIFQAGAIGLAYDNNIWVYDELEAKLKRIGDDGSLLDQTTDLRQLVDSVPDPSIIADQNGLVYLYDSTKGVYIFDHYGSFKKHISLTGWKDFSVLEKNLLGRNQQYFYRYQLDQVNIQTEPIPQSCLNAIKITITSGLVYVMKQNELDIYAQR